MNSPQLIKLETYWRLAEWDDFFHIDDDGNRKINYLQPYFYRLDDGLHHQIARIQKRTDLNYLKQLTEEGRVYLMSKASTEETLPVPYYHRSEIPR